MTGLATALRTGPGFEVGSPGGSALQPYSPPTDEERGHYAADVEHRQRRYRRSDAEVIVEGFSRFLDALEESSVLHQAIRDDQSRLVDAVICVRAVVRRLTPISCEQLLEDGGFEHEAMVVSADAVQRKHAHSAMADGMIAKQMSKPRTSVDGGRGERRPRSMPAAALAYAAGSSVGTRPHSVALPTAIAGGAGRASQPADALRALISRVSKVDRAGIVGIDVSFEDLIDRVIAFVAAYGFGGGPAGGRGGVSEVDHGGQYGASPLGGGSGMPATEVAIGSTYGALRVSPRRHLRTVYQVLRDVLVELPRGPAELAVVQHSLADHGAVAMLYSQMCHVPTDLAVYIALLETAAKCCQGGNRRVQEKFLGLMRMKPQALQVMQQQLRAASRWLREAATHTSAGAGGSIALLLGVHVALHDKGGSSGGADAGIKPGGSNTSGALNDPPHVAVVTTILNLLQVWCEGHNLAMQNFLRTQGGKGRPANLVAECVAVLRDMQPLLQSAAAAMPRTRPSSYKVAEQVGANLLFPLAIQALNTLTELVQGPCPSNQMELVTHKFVEVVGAMVESLGGRQGLQGKELQQKCLLAMTSLFEGRKDRAIHTRVASLLNTQTLKDTMTAVYVDFRQHHDTYCDEAFLQVFNDTFGATDVQSLEERTVHGDTVVIETGFAAFILLSHLAEVDPVVAAEVAGTVPQAGVGEFGMEAADSGSGVAGAAQRKRGSAGDVEAEAFDFFRRHTGAVEVVRGGSLERFLFPVPPMCQYLTETTKDRLKWSINRDSAAKKIEGLFGHTGELLEEMRHQQRLRRRLRRLPCFTWMYDRRHWWYDAAFIVAWTVNLLILACYSSANGEMECSTELLGIDTNWPIDQVIQVCGTVLLAIGCVMLVTYVLDFGTLQADQRARSYAEARAGHRKRRRGDESGKASQGAHGSNQDSVGVLGFTIATSHVQVADALNGGEEDATVDAIFARRRLASLAAERSKGRGCGAACCKATSAIGHAIRWLSYLFRSGRMMYNTSYVAACILGLVLHHFFFAYCLSDLVTRYEELIIVLRSVTRPRKSLALTAALFLVFEYWFAIAGFAFFRDSYDAGGSCTTPSCQNQCSSLFVCLFTTFDQGFKNDGGVGGYLADNLYDTNDSAHEHWTWAGRLFFDSMFNIILLTVLLNIVFGIIIDTFAELREHTTRLAEDMQNLCFICNIERQEFDRQGLGFEHHIVHDHNAWSYVDLMAHLLLKPSTELTGVEDYLMAQLRADDLSFLPLQRALVLQHVAMHGLDAGSNAQPLVGSSANASSDHGWSAGVATNGNSKRPGEVGGAGVAVVATSGGPLSRDQQRDGRSGDAVHNVSGGGGGGGGGAGVNDATGSRAVSPVVPL